MKDEIRGVLFDLDGTLADTAPDLAYTLNTLLQEQGRATLTYDRIRPVVSNGASALIRLGFGIDEGAPVPESLRERFLQIYAENLVRDTRLFPGMAELLDALETRAIGWGVVTNKPAWLTEPLMDRLGLAQRAGCIVSGDTTTNRKPHPEPILYACRSLGLHSRQCLYVGDAHRDIEAGRRAGMVTLVALFGYIQAHERPEDWLASGMIARPVEVLDWLQRQAAADA